MGTTKAYRIYAGEPLRRVLALHAGESPTHVVNQVCAEWEAMPCLIAACREMSEYFKGLDGVKNMNSPLYGIWHRAMAALDKSESVRH